VHQLLAQTLEDCYAEIRGIQQEARKNGFKKQPIWPMIILRTPKGWTCPKEVDGIPVEGTFRAHQVPLATVRENLSITHKLHSDHDAQFYVGES
jgi:xylulose-5-phosphate/fructose-6-phosphate phosphoketolase